MVNQAKSTGQKAESLKCVKVHLFVPVVGVLPLFEMGLLDVFVKGDRNLKLKLAVLLTSQWYYLITRAGSQTILHHRGVRSYTVHTITQLSR